MENSDFSLAFRFDAAGWGIFEVASGGTSICGEMFNSWYDPLGDVAEGFLDLVLSKRTDVVSFEILHASETADDRAEKNLWREISWIGDEDDVYKWRMKRDGIENLFVEFHYFLVRSDQPNLPSGIHGKSACAVRSLQFYVPLTQFGQALAHAMPCLLKAHGFVGYRKLRNSTEYPMFTLLRLLRWLKTGNSDRSFIESEIDFRDEIKEILA